MLGGIDDIMNMRIDIIVDGLRQDLDRLQLDLEIGKGGGEIADPPGEPFRGEARRAPKDKMPVVELRRELHCGGNDVDQALCNGAMETCADLGQLTVGTRCAIKQGAACPLFERAQMPADCGMVDRKRFRGTPNPTACTDGFECLQCRKGGKRAPLVGRQSIGRDTGPCSLDAALFPIRLHYHARPIASRRSTVTFLIDRPWRWVRNGWH